MKEWFKARNIWGASLRALPDAEAGRLAKAMWAFTMDGEIMPLKGAESGIFPMILMTLTQDEERESDISAKRSNAAKNMHMQANASKSMQMQASACKSPNKNKNKNIDKEQESESESLMDDAEAHGTQREQNRVLDAAEDAGFRMSNDVRASLIALYADFGLIKMLEGIKSCVEHDAPNLAYLRAVLRGKPKQTKVVVNAQDFGQRDYSDVESQMMDDLAEEMKAFKGAG